MTLRLQIGDEVRPQQTPELILSRRGRAVSSLVTGPVGRRTQLPRPVGDRPSPPHPGDGQDHQATGGAMIPMNVPVQGLKTLVKRGGNPDDAAHEAMLLEPMGHGR
jgi:hypothetical protein